MDSLIRFITRNAKAFVAVAVIVVATGASALGVDTGIDVEHWWQVLGAAVLGGGFVWVVPNSDEDEAS